MEWNQVSALPQFDTLCHSFYVYQYSGRDSSAWADVTQMKEGYVGGASFSVLDPETDPVRCSLWAADRIKHLCCENLKWNKCPGTGVSSNTQYSFGKSNKLCVCVCVHSLPV